MKHKAVTFISKYGTAILIVLSFAFFSIKMPDIWLTSYVMITILEQSVSLGLVALGLTVVNAAGEMDMSIGSIASLGSMITMFLIVGEQSIPVAIIATLLIGAAIGFVNGFMRTKMRIPGMIPTIGTQIAVAGIAMMVNSGNIIYGGGHALDTLTTMGRGYLGENISIPAIIFLVVALLVWFMMSKTRQGRLFYVIGGNKEASRLSGVQLHLNVILAYVICGALGAFAGLMSAARSGSGNPEAGINFLLDGLIAITLGSTFLTEEREYKALGSVVGALYITMMINGMQMMGCGNHQQCIMRGVLLLVGLTLSSLRRIATE